MPRAFGSIVRPGLAAVLAAAAAAACMRIDEASATIRVPAMATERDRIIVTNAAQHQLAGEMPDRKHFCQISVPRGIVAYHEGPALRDTRYVDRIRQSLASAGYAADAIAAVRLGGISPRILVDADRREVRVRGFNALHAARRNFEFMIASAGYAANREPANGGLRDGMPRGWEPGDGWDAAPRNRSKSP
jgi:hypothetical protein